MATLQLLREPRVRRWTLEEYYTMAETGLFAGQRVELLDGEIIEMSPQGEPHIRAASLADSALRLAFGPIYWLRLHAPLHLGGDNEPEPDLAVLRGTPNDVGDPLQAVVLIVEVSDSSLTYDRTRKAGYYARAGIADYWIINLIERQLEIRRHPVSDPAQPEGFRYADVTILAENDSATPLALPEARIDVRDLLPRVDV
jgi:Uma2 family endonuclease